MADWPNFCSECGSGLEGHGVDESSPNAPPAEVPKFCTECGLHFRKSGMLQIRDIPAKTTHHIARSSRSQPLLGKKKDQSTIARELWKSTEARMLSTAETRSGGAAEEAEYVAFLLESNSWNSWQRDYHKRDGFLNGMRPLLRFLALLPPTSLPGHIWDSIFGVLMVLQAVGWTITNIFGLRRTLRSALVWFEVVNVIYACVWFVLWVKLRTMFRRKLKIRRKQPETKGVAESRRLSTKTQGASRHKIQIGEPTLETQSEIESESVTSGGLDHRKTAIALVDDFWPLLSLRHRYLFLFTMILVWWGLELYMEMKANLRGKPDDQVRKSIAFTTCMHACIISLLC